MLRVVAGIHYILLLATADLMHKLTLLVSTLYLKAPDMFQVFFHTFIYLCLVMKFTCLVQLI